MPRALQKSAIALAVTLNGSENSNLQPPEHALGLSATPHLGNLSDGDVQAAEKTRSKPGACDELRRG